MRRAFTILELLILIVIVAALAAMLMPALCKARGEARKISGSWYPDESMNADRGGRPSVDPVLMLKMMLLGYLFDIESDRRRTEQEALHLRPGPRPLHLSGAQAAQVEPLSRAATRALLHGQSQRLQRLPAQVAVHHGAAAQRISVGAAICT